MNFIGAFIASQATMELAGAHVAAGGNVSRLMMGGLAAQAVQANPIYLLTVGLAMALSRFLSKDARRVIETEIKLSSANTGKERFGCSMPARRARALHSG